MNLITKTLDPTPSQDVDQDEMTPDNVIESEIRASEEEGKGALADAVWKAVLVRLKHKRPKNEESKEP
jgi:hypothetical protein